MSAAYDIEFAHAVGRAATGIRKQVGCDPEKNGAELATILRSDDELDEHGLALFAQGVTGKLRKRRDGKQPEGESRFAEAVRDAFDAWRKDDEADPAIEGEPLAKILKDEQLKMRPGERELLAQLIVGDMRRGKARPQKGAGHPDVTGCMSVLRAKLRAGMVHKNAILDTAAEVGVSPRTVEKYEAISREWDEELRKVAARKKP